MWTISATHDLPSLRGGGGEPFTEFVDSLLRTHCFAIGIPDTSIATTLRVNVRDGGVDTTIDRGDMADTTERLCCPSAWQYKAVSTSEVSVASVVREIQKPHVTKLVSQGYGYRLCVCDELTAQKKSDLEAALNKAAREISPAAQQCFVLSGSDIAAWANRYPGFVGVRFNRPATIARHWEAWRTTERAVTRSYILPTGWEERQKAIQRHVDFTLSPNGPVLSVQGLAGVGKTRLVFEAISQVRGAAELVVVTNDEKSSSDVARWLANSADLSAILVADECPIKGRFDLDGLLRGNEKRIRAIAIDNTGEPPIHGAAGIWLESADRDTTERILGANFASVPVERRRAYADMSGGYVRLAADLCRSDTQMTLVGGLGPVLSSVDDYYRKRIGDDAQKVVEAIALVQRIGYSDDVEEQLLRLAELTGIDAKDAIETAHRLKDAPGFIAITGRYLYVTPQIIAEVAFRRAWKRWALLQPSKFLNRIPELLLPAFQLRVRGLADTEVRSTVSAHFRRRIADFVPSDLADHKRVEQFLGLLDTDPNTYLPQLTSLIAQANAEELAAINEGTYGSKGARRNLVWAAENLARFPEYFDNAELILRRLALVETEPGIGNNATGIWRQLFRVYLSGTSVPFLQRFEIFKRTALSDAGNESELALGGLKDVIDIKVTRMGGPSVVAGRIPPADWRPTTLQERGECLSAVLEFVEQLLTKSERLAEAGWKYLGIHLRMLLAWYQLQRLQGIINRNPLPPGLLGPWLEEIDNFLQYDCTDHVSEEYRDQVVAWRNLLLPTDFPELLRVIIGKDYWHHSMRETMWNAESEVVPLVAVVIKNPKLLEDNLDYLVSPEARSAAMFGVVLGRQDVGAKYLDLIVNRSRQAQSGVLLRGYISGLLETDPQKAALVNEVIDKLESDDPQIAVEMITSVIDVTDAVRRLLRMISAGRIPAAYVQYLHYGGVVRKASSTIFAALLRTLVPQDSPAEHLKYAVDLIGDRLNTAESLAQEDSATIAMIKEILERSAAIEDGAGHWWRHSVNMLAPLDPDWAASTAAAAVAGEDFDKRNGGRAVLSSIAANHPEKVMNVVGAALLNPKQKWLWLLGAHRPIFESLPADTVLNWLDSAGMQGARMIARHLPSPTLDPSGACRVPDLTARVLDRFGEDEQVLEEFVAGRHHLETIIGPWSSNFEAHRRVANAFLNHPLAPIRRWAQIEVASSEKLANEWRKQEEDEAFER